MICKSACWCERCGYVGTGEADHCPDCCAVLTRSAPPSKLLDFVMLAAVALAIALGVLALSGCSGPHFSAREGAPLLSPAGAGGYPITMSQAGAGGVGGDHYPAAVAGASAGAAPLAAGAGGGGGDVAAAGAGGSSIPDPVHACDRALWTATAFGWKYVTDAGGIQTGGGPPSAAVDADRASSWTSGAAQAPGQWLEVDLGALSTLSEITLRGPVLPAVTLELDGEPVAVSSQSSSGSIVISFEPTSARVVRLELEQSAAAWWQITDLAAVCQ